MSARVLVATAITTLLISTALAQQSGLERTVIVSASDQMRQVRFRCCGEHKASASQPAQLRQRMRPSITQRRDHPQARQSPQAST
jgi:hypothetical protein